MGVSMKKVFLLCLVSTLLVGCNSNHAEKVSVDCDTYYIDTTETWTVNTFDGYKVTSMEKVHDEETDTYTVTLKIEHVLE